MTPEDPASPTPAAPVPPVDNSSRAIILVVLLIVGSIIFLIAAAVFGVDNGVLVNMARADFARGLITYLFAVVTIGTAVVLVLSVLISANSEYDKERFQRGKEVLSLLLGVFGAIVGFYFGSSNSNAPVRIDQNVQLLPLDLSPRAAKEGEKVVVRGVIAGGSLPYRFGAALGADVADPKEPAGENGWIVKELTVRKFRSDEPGVVHVVVQDAAGRRSEQMIGLAVR